MSVRANPKETPKVPFLDLHQQYLSIKEEIDGAVAEVIGNSSFVRGPYVDRFEGEFAESHGAKHCVSCGNGTDALYIAMKALGVKEGDEVIVPAMSWISTSETVTQAGGQVVFCDIDTLFYTIDPEQIQEKITSRTVGIIPVHLYGHPADMDAILSIADRHGLWILEDCAQAHLASDRGRTVGTIGTAGTFSFYPGKNLGAMGDAGAILTNDLELAEKMARFARHGGLRKGEHLIEGINSRMDGLQAVILSVKLRLLPEWTRRRRMLAATYTELLQDAENIQLPQVREEAEPVWHLYVIQNENRDDLRRNLDRLGIQTGIQYPVALPFLPCYDYLRHQLNDFPVAGSLQNHCLSLPLFPEETKEQINHVLSALKGHWE